VVGKYLSVEPYAVMLRRDEPQFESLVNRALIDLFQSVEIRRIDTKWFNTNDLTIPLNPYLKEAFAAPNTYPAGPCAGRLRPQAQTAAAASSGSRSPSRGQAAISVVSTSFSNSG
jgi:glutamate/aspartate transport system substrate-binding protein